MDKQKYIEKHKNNVRELYHVQKSGGVVTGQDVDEENHLLYIVKTDQGIDVVRANKVPIVRKLHEAPGHKKTLIIPLKKFEP